MTNNKSGVTLMTRTWVFRIIVKSFFLFWLTQIELLRCQKISNRQINYKIQSKCIKELSIYYFIELVVVMEVMKLI